MPRTVNTAVVSEMFTTPSAESLAVLREMFELLQDYAPIWYTEELHNRAAATLGEPELVPAI